MMARKVLDHDTLVRRYARKATLVRVVLAIRAMHGENPLATFNELEHMNRVGEAIWPPPPGDARRIIDAAKT